MYTLITIGCLVFSKILTDKSNIVSFVSLYSDLCSASLVDEVYASLFRIGLCFPDIGPGYEETQMYWD